MPHTPNPTHHTIPHPPTCSHTSSTVLPQPQIWPSNRTAAHRHASSSQSNCKTSQASCPGRKKPNWRPRSRTYKSLRRRRRQRWVTASATARTAIRSRACLSPSRTWPRGQSAGTSRGSMCAGPWLPFGASSLWGATMLRMGYVLLLWRLRSWGIADLGLG